MLHLQMHETDEARHIRESYNVRAGDVSQPWSQEEGTVVVLPTTAGSVSVTLYLTDVVKPAARQGLRVTPLNAFVRVAKSVRNLQQAQQSTRILMGLTSRSKAQSTRSEASSSRAQSRRSETDRVSAGSGHQFDSPRDLVHPSDEQHGDQQATLARNARALASSAATAAAINTATASAVKAAQKAAEAQKMAALARQRQRAEAAQIASHWQVPCASLQAVTQAAKPGFFDWIGAAWRDNIAHLWISQSALCTIVQVEAAGLPPSVDLLVTGFFIDAPEFPGFPYRWVPCTPYSDAEPPPNSASSAPSAPTDGPRVCVRYNLAPTGGVELAVADVVDKPQLALRRLINSVAPASGSASAAAASDDSSTALTTSHAQRARRLSGLGFTRPSFPKPNFHKPSFSGSITGHKSSFSGSITGHKSSFSGGVAGSSSSQQSAQQPRTVLQQAQPVPSAFVSDRSGSSTQLQHRSPPQVRQQSPLQQRITPQQV